ncbi:MAG: Crp/Fnr family transcriptional regulator [Thiogranum sp.]|nr:Crp/Fnr family transcriptional regulator [Thiogranum sp.]
MRQEELAVRQPPAGVRAAEELRRAGVDARIIDLLRQEPVLARSSVYQPGETLYHEGADVDVVYVPRRGKVKLLSYLPDGRARIVRLHKRGSVLGLNGLLGDAHGHTAIAVDQVEAYQIPINALLALKDDDPLAYSQLLEQWHRSLSTADTWITDFSTGAVRGRVARLVQFLIDMDDEHGPCEVALLTGEEMAEVLGVTPESISRTLADFKRLGILIPLDDRNAECFRCDLDALASEAES